MNCPLCDGPMTEDRRFKLQDAFRCPFCGYQALVPKGYMRAAVRKCARPGCDETVPARTIGKPGVFHARRCRRAAYRERRRSGGDSRLSPAIVGLAYAKCVRCGYLVYAKDRILAMNFRDDHLGQVHWPWEQSVEAILEGELIPRNPCVECGKPVGRDWTTFVQVDDRARRPWTVLEWAPLHPHCVIQLVDHIAEDPGVPNEHSYEDPMRTRRR